MTDQPSDSLKTFVRDALVGSLIMQRATKLGLSLDDLYEPTNPFSCEIYTYLIDTLGEYPDTTATHTILALTLYLKQPNVVKANTACISQLLWNTMGDPDSNGTTPPVMYREAAYHIYTWLILQLSSSFSS